MGTAIKHPVPDRVKPSFVIFDIQALWRSVLSVREILAAYHRQWTREQGFGSVAGEWFKPRW